MGIHAKIDSRLTGSRVAQALKEAAEKCNYAVDVTTETRFAPGSVREEPLAHNIQIRFPLRHTFLRDWSAAIDCHVGSEINYDEISFTASIIPKATRANKIIAGILLACVFFPGLVWMIATMGEYPASVRTTDDPQFNDIKPHLHSLLEQFYQIVKATP